MTDVVAGVENETPSEPGATAAPVVDDQLVGMLVDRARAEGLQLTGEGGLLQQLTKRVIESALDGETTDHLGYEKHDAAGRDGGNSRNGRRSKTVTTEVGPVEISVPRDVEGSFEPQLVKKRQRRLTGVGGMVLSLSAKGLTHGEISAHLAEVYGASVSKSTVTTITIRFCPPRGMRTSPLEAFATTDRTQAVYPVLFVDAIHVKIHDAQVANRPIYVVMAVTVDGHRDKRQRPHPQGRPAPRALPQRTSRPEVRLLAPMSLDPTGKGRRRWTMRWKAPLNAFEIAFEGRLAAARR